VFSFGCAVIVINVTKDPEDLKLIAFSLLEQKYSKR